MTDNAAALQSALASVHAAIWAYGEIGARISDDHLAAVQAADAALRAQRGDLEALIRTLGAEPVASKPGYSLPSPVTDDASALALAASLDDDLAAQWRYCAGQTSSTPARTFVVDALGSSALSAMRWRQLAGHLTVPAFPGLQ